MATYIDTHTNKSILRTFTKDVDESELVWHRDRNNRTVRILQSNGWKFQYDNELPFTLNRDDVITIPKEMFHRIIKGDGDLIIEITEE